MEWRQWGVIVQFHVVVEEYTTQVSDGPGDQ